MSLLALISGFLVLGDREKFYSPAFLSVTFIFLINLSTCTWRQLRQATHSRGAGNWGSAVTHSGLLIIVIGALIKLTLDFSGVFSVPVGGSFDDRQNGYLLITQEFTQRHEYGQFKLFLQEIKIKSLNKGNEFQGLVSLVMNGELVSQQWTRLGQPLSHGLWNFYYTRPGYYVSVTFQDRYGPPKDYLLRLNTYKNDWSEEYKGEFKINSGKYILSLSHDPKNQSGYVAIIRLNGTSKRLYSGILPVGSEVKLPGGEKFSLVNSIPAVIFTAKKEPGLYVVYTGFCVTMVGIFVLVWRRKKS